MGTSEVRQLIDEGLRYQGAGSHERALARYRAAAEAAIDPAARSEAIRRQSDVHRTRSEWTLALETACEAERIATEHELHDLIAEALNAQGSAYHMRGEREQAEPFYLRAYDISSHPRVRGVVMQNLGTLAGERGNPVDAAARFKEAYEYCKEAGYERGMLFALMNYARATLDQGKNDEAEKLLHEAEILAINMMDLDVSHLAALNRAEAMITRGAYDEAEMLISAALGYYGNSGNPYRRIDALRLLGDITVLRGTAEQARMFFEAARELAQRIEAAPEVERLTQRIDDLKASAPRG